MTGAKYGHGHRYPKPSRSPYRQSFPARVDGVACHRILRFLYSSGAGSSKSGQRAGKHVGLPDSKSLQSASCGAILRPLHQSTRHSPASVRLISAWRKPAMPSTEPHEHQGSCPSGFGPRGASPGRGRQVLSRRMETGRGAKKQHGRPNATAKESMDPRPSGVTMDTHEPHRGGNAGFWTTPASSSCK